MTKQTLSEDELQRQIFESIDKGDTTALNNLMSMEVEITKAKPVEAESLVDDLVPPEEAAEEEVEEVETTEEVATEQQDTGTDAGTDKAPVDDWRSVLPPEIKAKVDAELGTLRQQNDQLQQYYRSNEGRVSALQKQVNKLKEVSSTVKAPVDTAAPTPITLPTDDAFEELKELDPALYEKLKAREATQLKAISGEFNKLRQEFNAQIQQNINPLREQEEERYMLSEAQKVLEQAPDVRDIVSSQDWNVFKTIVPPGVKAMAESKSADDMLTAIYLFRQWAGVAPPQQHQEQVEVVPAAQLDTSKVVQERQRKLSSATEGTKVPVTGQKRELSEEEAIEAAFKLHVERDFKNRII